MPFVKYSMAQKAEAVALAAVLGLSAASDQLGIPEDSIASWARRAGKDPADRIEPASWERLADLALTKAERMVAEGKMSAAQLANLAGMAEQKAAARPKVETTEDPDADLLAAIRARYRTDADLAYAITEHVLRWSLHDAPPATEDEAPSPEAAEWLNAALLAILGRTADLEAMAERFADVERAYAARQKVIAARAVVLAQSGLAMHEAYAMAAELSDDHPMPSLEGLIVELPA